MRKPAIQQEPVASLRPEPQIIPSAEHPIARRSISPNALRILDRLHKAGYSAYLVGGCVRDLLLDLSPKDFDIATDAHPQQIRELFRNCRLIGRRFRLAHIYFGSEILEVSTFRRQPRQTSETHSEQGSVVCDNEYGTIDDDVWRRDFTINALFYDVQASSVVDYTGGMEDIQQRRLRLIGEPQLRYHEDPVRMLRAVRFAAKLDFHIEPRATACISQLAHLLQEISPSRLFEEFQKLFLYGHGWETFEQLRHYGLFYFLFPQTEEVLTEPGNMAYPLLRSVLQDSDRRRALQQPCSPGFLLAALLWYPMHKRLQEYSHQELEPQQAIELAGDATLSQQVKSLSIPRRFTCMARDVWRLQQALQNPRPRRRARLLRQAGLSAACDLLEHRCAAGEDLGAALEYWQPLIREQATPATPATRSSRARRRRRSRS